MAKHFATTCCHRMVGMLLTFRWETVHVNEMSKLFAPNGPTKSHRNPNQINMKQNHQYPYSAILYILYSNYKWSNSKIEPLNFIPNYLIPIHVFSQFPLRNHVIYHDFSTFIQTLSYHFRQQMPQASLETAPAPWCWLSARPLHRRNVPRAPELADHRVVCAKHSREFNGIHVDPNGIDVDLNVHLNGFVWWFI